jgi:hypothetical protein
MGCNLRREVLQSMLEEVVADPSTDVREVDAVLVLARRFGLEDVERLAANRLLG